MKVRYVGSPLKNGTLNPSTVYEVLYHLSDDDVVVTDDTGWPWGLYPEEYEVVDD